MTTYNHTAIVNGDSRGNDAAIWNDPLSSLDATIGNISAFTTHGSMASWVSSLGTVTGSAVTLANGSQSSGATTLTVDSTSGFVTGGYIGYVRQDGTYEERQITVASGTTLTVSATGGIIADNTPIYMVPSGLRQMAAQQYSASGVDIVQMSANLNRGKFYPEAYSTTGTGVDSATAINAAIVAANAAGGGDVLLTKAQYDIETTIQMASNVRLVGRNTANATTLAQATLVYLADAADVDMVNIPFGTIGACILNVRFDGNKTNQVATDLYGIYYEPGTRLTLTSVTGTYSIDETVTGGTSTASGTVRRIEGSQLYVGTITGTFQTSETITGGTSSATGTSSSIDPARGRNNLYEVNVFNISGVGVYIGDDQAETDLNHVGVLYCTSSGVELYAEDCIFIKTQSGLNGGYGLDIGGGGGRFFTCDFHGNDEDGIYIHNSNGNIFFLPYVNNNEKYGVRIDGTGSVGRRNQFIGGTIHVNSAAATDTYANVRVENNAYQNQFVGVRLYSTETAGNRPDYGIEDANGTPSGGGNVAIGCLLGTSSQYSAGIVSANVELYWHGLETCNVSGSNQPVRAYMRSANRLGTPITPTEGDMRHNTTANRQEVYAEDGHTEWRWKDSYAYRAGGTGAITVAADDHFVLATGTSGTQTATLPALGDVPTGKVFEIIKFGSGGTLQIACTDGSINGASTVSTTTRYESIRCVKLSASVWMATKQDAPTTP